MKKFGLLVALGGCVSSVVFPSFASAGQFGILGSVGYESMTSDDDDDNDTKMTGLGLGVMAQYEFYSAGMLGLLGGLGPKYASVSHEKNGVKYSLSELMLGFEGGLEIGAVPKVFTLQATIGYDLGLSGSGEVRYNSASVDRDTDSFSRLNLNGRALFAVAPTVDIGMGLQWFSGTYELKDVNHDYDFHGFELQFLGRISL